MTGVGTDVAPLVVAVDGQVEPHKLSEVRVVVIAEHGGEVSGPVLVRVNAADFSITIEVAVDDGSQRRQLGYQIHSVFVDVLREGEGVRKKKREGVQREREREREREKMTLLRHILPHFNRACIYNGSVAPHH